MRGYMKVRRCTIEIDTTKWECNNGEFVFYEARIKEIYYTNHPEIKLEQIPAEFTKDYFYKVGDILKSKDGRSFYETKDGISSELY